MCVNENASASMPASTTSLPDSNRDVNALLLACSVCLCVCVCV